MVTVAGPRRIHTGFLLKCAVFGGWSPNRTPCRSIASLRREAHRADRKADVTKVEITETVKPAKMTM